METSAKTGMNVDLAFMAIARYKNLKKTNLKVIFILSFADYLV